MLWLYRRVVFGRLASSEIKELKDLNKVEIYIFSSLVFLTLFFGAFLQNQPSNIGQSFGPLLDLVYYVVFDFFNFKPWFVNIIQFSLLLVQASMLNHIFKSQFINQQID